MERIDTSGSYVNSRDVTKRFRLSPGNYIIIPSTYDEDRACEFLLRIFTQEKIETKLINKFFNILSSFIIIKVLIIFFNFLVF